MTTNPDHVRLTEGLYKNVSFVTIDLMLIDHKVQQRQLLLKLIIENMTHLKYI